MNTNPQEDSEKEHPNKDHPVEHPRASRAICMLTEHDDDRFDLHLIVKDLTDLDAQSLAQALREALRAWTAERGGIVVSVKEERCLP